MEPYESGPGRMWLFWLFGAGVWLVLAAAGPSRGAVAIAQGVAGLAFSVAALRAQRSGVRADESGLVLRYAGDRTRRLSWDDVRDVVPWGPDEARKRPAVLTREGARLWLLDNWHDDPEGVLVEVRHRFMTHRGPGDR